MRVITHKICWLLAVSLLSFPSAYGADPLGKTLLARGTVTADRNGAAEALRRLSPVFKQDILRSGNNARAQFRMIDDAYLNLQQNTVLRLDKYQFKKGSPEGSVAMELISGGLRTITGVVGKKDKKDYQLKTPLATIGIRGTMYEVEIVPSGMYVAAWNGQINVKAHSGKCDLTLGDAQQFRFALVSRDGQCQPLEEVPAPFSDGHTSESTKQVRLDGVEIEPLFDNPEQEETYDFGTILLGLGDSSLLNGQANTVTGDEILLLADNNVAGANGQVTGFSRNVGGYPVNWGRWENYTLQDAAGNAVAVDDDDGLLWITYQATDPDTVMARSGTVRYDNVAGSLVQSSMGEVSNFAVQMDVNFDDGAVTNGALAANVPGYTWTGVFDGQVQDGDLTLQYNGGALVDAETGAFTNTSGEIAGDFVGDDAEAVAGGFSMVDDANNDNQIEGVFVVEKQP